MAKEAKQLDDLFHDTLKDIYFAEKKILGTLPKMAKVAQSPDLKKAFESHHRETEGHFERLEQVFGIIEKTPQAKTCDAIMGILKEGQEIMDEYKGSPALDAGLLAAAQAVEHYEISRYARSRRGPTSLDTMMLQSCLMPPFRKRRRLTRPSLRLQNPSSIRRRRRGRLLPHSRRHQPLSGAHCMPIMLSGNGRRSLQFGRTSAPIIPHLVQTALVAQIIERRIVRPAVRVDNCAVMAQADGAMDQQMSDAVRVNMPEGDRRPSLGLCSSFGQRIAVGIAVTHPTIRPVVQRRVNRAIQAEYLPR